VTVTVSVAGYRDGIGSRHRLLPLSLPPSLSLPLDLSLPLTLLLLVLLLVLLVLRSARGGASHR
jgi:hypothetical protein